MRAELADVELHYELTGAPGGRTIAMTHGIGGSGDTWAQVAEGLGEKYQILTWDVRGHARSGRPAGGYAIAQFAADLAGLLDHLGIPDAVIMGSSMGGTITQRFILDFPDKTAAAVIMSTSSEVNEAGRARWEGQADFIEANGMRAFIERGRPASQTPAYLAEHPEIVEAEERRIANNPDGKVYAQVARAVAFYNYTQELETVRTPTLVLVGDQDTSTPPGGSVIISRRIPGAELHILPGLGHSLEQLDPKQVVDLVGDFLARRLPD
ncbi:MAG: alpha/beta hydrolase [Frankiaceae bacterium]|jgi:3-oxoadipate enol-lactonase/3-oxoadipate enol-lactonase/4-carboxymuconolactone decarboxylase|nr:alpha/beta hydrolase [Frankiaceae bacterium]